MTERFKVLLDLDASMFGYKTVSEMRSRCNADEYANIFKSGANWTLDHIWHTVEEKPERDGLILHLVDDRFCVWGKEFKESLIEKELNIYLATDSRSKGPVSVVKRWCYIRDLLSDSVYHENNETDITSNNAWNAKMLECINNACRDIADYEKEREDNSKVIQHFSEDKQLGRDVLKLLHEFESCVKNPDYFNAKYGRRETKKI